jgi:uncharacterized protein (TIGR02145 family)
MTRVDKIRTGVGVVSIVLAIAFGSAGASLERRSAEDRQASAATVVSKRMADGKQWTTRNLSVQTDSSWCYEDSEPNCRQYGRLYTWESARRGCELLGDGWRLPTDDDWRQLARRYGGTLEDSKEGSKAAYEALSVGGSSGFDAMLGGNRNHEDGRYARLEAHGFYWTSSDGDPHMAWFYNFGRGGGAVNRHRGGHKEMAVSVRCVRP